MVANVRESVREIGVLRAIGLSNRAVLLLFCWEAFALVTAASFLGGIIGATLAWTMSMQTVTLLQTPVAFVFPSGAFSVVCISGLLCAFFSACIATKAVTSRTDVVQILRAAEAG